MATNWRDYQEESAELFKSMGLEAATNVTVQGVRTKHNVDVVVKSHHAGFDITWLVECKHWKSPVSKLHVLALREIVSDTGADRGFLLCEVGFQSGALEAANLTNVRVTSLEDVRSTAGKDISAIRLRDLYDRIENQRERYWNMSKEHRILHNLRPEVGQVGYSATRMLEICSELVTRAFRGQYPFQVDSFNALYAPLKNALNSTEEVVATVTSIADELEGKLLNAETAPA